VRRAFPALAEGEHTDVAGVIIGLLAAVYGIVLAFVIVALYEDFQDAQSVVRSEATNLAQLYRDSQVLGGETSAAMQREIRAYLADVHDVEWPLLADGDSSAEAWLHLERMFDALSAYKPRTDAQGIFHGEAVSKLNDVVSDRRERLDHAGDELPTEFEVLLVGGAVLVIGFLYFLGTRSLQTHMLMVAAVAGLTAFILLLAVVLDHPFSGEVTISNQPFEADALLELDHDALERK
jgi:hypothetical protein